MKKLYQSEKWKRHSKRISRRIERNSYREYIPSSRPGLIRAQNFQIRREIINVPEIFSIIDNPNEMVETFRKVEQAVGARKQVFLDMSKVVALTPDAILYMLSRIDHFRSSRKRASISGNVPDDVACRRLLMTSGFFKHVHLRERDFTPPMDENILTIKKGIFADGPTAKEVRIFATDHINVVEPSRKRGIYSTMVECMANTNDHAYNKKSSGRWWLMAVHDTEGKRVRFSFLDNGRTIPKTVRKKFTEKFSRGLQKYIPLAPAIADSDLIVSALSGDFRTETGEKYRGKGLPKIYREADCGNIQNLVIVSASGYYSHKGGQEKTLSSELPGTLLSWDFVNGSQL